MRVCAIRPPPVSLQALVLAATVLLAGCASRPSPPPRPLDRPAPLPVATSVVDAQLQDFGQRQQEQALRAEADGRWADAVLAWETLALLRPGDAQTGARLAAAQGRIAAAVREREASADAARRRGDVESAAESYLELLALDPAHRAAADGLRQIERERNRRSQVARFARPEPARRPAPRPGMVVGEAMDPAGVASSLREHATMLARQGDLDGAIQLLADSPPARKETALRSLLVELYLQKAQSLRRQQPQAARAAVDAALALDRSHAAALALRQQLSRAAVAPR